MLTLLKLCKQMLNIEVGKRLAETALQDSRSWSTTVRGLPYFRQLAGLDNKAQKLRVQADAVMRQDFIKTCSDYKEFEWPRRPET